MTSEEPKRAVIYARLSVSNEESVSISRQVESCTKFVQSQGWELVATRIDEGVSATHNKPEQRLGWRSVLDLPDRYDVVVVWKTDRLARRVLDFLHADESLQHRGAAVRSATEPIDMTTDTGRAFATMLAVFAELEAKGISARVKAARDYLIRNGRAVGGTVPYGYKSVRNPDGPGYVIVQDSATIGFVIEAADRARNGDTLYSIRQWLTANAPLPTTSQKHRKHSAWAYSTVERLLRNPILAGMTAYNPGNVSRMRGGDVLRDEAGMPVVDESLAILSTSERRDMLAKLDAKDNPQRMPRASKNSTSPFLSRVATCGDCNVIMTRGTTDGRPMLTCPKCHQTISTRQLVPLIESRLLDERGDEHSVEEVADTTDNSAAVADIEDAMNVVTDKMKQRGTDRVALMAQLEGLIELRESAESERITRYVVSVHTTNVRHEWETASTDGERRAVLMSQLSSLTIHRGKVGRRLDPSRVRIVWHPAGQYEDAMSAIYDAMEPGDKFTEG